MASTATLTTETIRALIPRSLRSRFRGKPTPATRQGQLGHVALFVYVAGLLAYLGFHEGGSYPGATGFAVVLAAAGAIAWLTLAPSPFAGWGRLAVVAVGAMALFTAWTVLSATWSGSPYRALVEGQRAALYLLAFALLAAIPPSPRTLRVVLGAVFVGLAALVLAGLVSRTLPDVWPTDRNPVDDRRVSYPVGYWNALGMAAGATALLALHHAADRALPALVRVASAALVPVGCAVLMLTLSRGAIGATILGLVVYVVAGWSRGLVPALVAVALPAALALTAAYDADLLISVQARSPAAMAQGEDLIGTVALAAGLAVALRALLLLGDRALARVPAPTRAARRALAAGAALALVALAVTAVARGAPDWADRQYHGFVDDRPLQIAALRDRLGNVGNNGRLDMWDVALDAFRAAPLRGSGAGTFALDWDRHRATDIQMVEAHSLYFDQLAEVGLVGLALLLGALAAAACGLAWRARGAARAPYGAALAVLAAVLAHSLVDFDWEIPAVTLVVFVLGGAGLASAREAGGVRAGARWGAIAACALVAVVPAMLAISSARYESARDALAAGDCATAAADAHAAAGLVGGHPPASAVEGVCALDAGDTALAIARFSQSVDGDTHNWRWRYLRAVALAEARRDPMADLRAALARNPRSLETRRAVFALQGAHGRQLAARARRLALPLE